jgi:hypothetical protein
VIVLPGKERVIYRSRIMQMIRSVGIGFSPKDESKGLPYMGGRCFVVCVYEKKSVGGGGTGLTPSDARENGRPNI